MTNDNYRSRLLRLHREKNWDPLHGCFIIADLIKRFSCKAIAEIGVCAGHTAAEILDRNELSVYYMIDPWVWQDTSGTGYTGEIAYQQVVKAFMEPCVKIMRMTSLEASCLTPDNSLDLAFIDAVHDYKNIRQDLSLWWPKVRKGGVLSGHDYNHPDPGYGVKKAVDEKFASDQIHLENDSVFWVKK